MSNNTSRRGSEPSLPSSKVSETSRGKRRRTSPEAPRPTSKKSRTNSLDNVDYSPEEGNEEEDEDDEDDGPVVASRRKLSSSTSLFQNPSESPQKPVERLRAIPKSLQLKTPMVSVSRADYLESNDLAEELFSSEKMSKQSSALPPFARAVQATGDKPSKLTQKQQSNVGAREKFKRKQDSHRQSADGLPRPLAETSLPSFKRATNGSGMTSHEFFNEHKRRPSAPITSNEVEWALLAGDKKDSESHMGNESVSVIADSAPQEDHTLSITRSPEINGNGSAIEGLSVRQPWKKAHPPGARLAHANIEKPRMPVKVPEPEVFKSFLTATQASEDIQDFSSQRSVPESTSSEEVLRALTAPSHQADDDANAISLVEEDDVLPPLGQAVQDTLEAVPDQALVPGDLPEPATSFETAPTQTESASLQAISTSVIGVANEASNKHQTEDATLPAVESAVPVEEATRKQETETSLSAPGTLVLGPEETVETSTNEREARAKINKSMLLPNESTRQDLHIFLDAPTYYCFQQRKSARVDRIFITSSLSFYTYRRPDETDSLGL